MPVVDLTIDASGSITGVQEYNKATNSAEQSTDTMNTKLSAAAVMFGNLASSAIESSVSIGIDFAKGIVQSASDFEETQNKFDVVFRDIGSYAEDSASRISSSFNLTKQATKQYMSSIQDLLVPTGLAREDAAKMSVKFTELAGDLASFNNLKTSDVIHDIQSALAGSAETMTKYGIDVKAAAVEEEILRQGLDTSTKAAERQAKVQAILAISLRDSSDAVGDVARSQGSFENQMRKAKATLKDFTTDLGTYLLPYATKAIQIFNKWATEGDGVQKTMLFLTKTLRFLYNGISGVKMAAEGIIIAFGYIAKAFTLTLTPLKYLLAGLEKLNLIDSNPIKDLADGVDDFIAASLEGLKETFKNVEESNAAFDKAEESFKKQAKEKISLKNDISVANKDQKSSTDDLITSIDSETDADLNSAAQKENKKLKLQELNDLLNQSSESIDEETDALNENTDAAGLFVDVYDDISSSQDNATTSIDGATIALNNHASELENVNSSLVTSTARYQSVSDMMSGFGQAVADTSSILLGFRITDANNAQEEINNSKAIWKAKEELFANQKAAITESLSEWKDYQNDVYDAQAKTTDNIADLEDKKLKKHIDIVKLQEKASKELASSENTILASTSLSLELAISQYNAIGTELENEVQRQKELASDLVKASQTQSSLTQQLSNSMGSYNVFDSLKSYDLFGSLSSSTNNYYFNQSVSRNDVANITSQQERNARR